MQNTMPKLLTLAILASISIVGFAQETVFRVPVRVVTVPTAVISPGGQFVRGLQPHEFRLFDNDRDQNLHLDYVEGPLSLAIVVQTNDAVRAWLPEVRRVASVVEATLLGATGEASVSTFGDDVKSLQPFSADTALLDKSFASISPGGDRSRCLDAVLVAAKQLAAVSPDRRRVILLIAQSGDVGSRAQLRDVLRELELNNIVLYSLVMPRVGKDLIKNTISIGSTNGAFGRSDTGIMGTIDLGKLIPEIFRGEKATSGQDEVTVLTGEMGGRRIPFRKLRDLEDGISGIGAELHTEYLLSYTPDRNTPGYHRIRVQVDRPDTVVRSRPGYYVPQSDASQ
jgi:VWFA-related protein